MSIELKIKSKHLGLEAKVIRHEEQKLRRQIEWAKETSSEQLEELRRQKNSLSSHRRHEVRNENRATFLARAYIKGTAYKLLEAKREPSDEYNFQKFVLPRVLAMIKKYHNPNLDLKHIEKWMEE